jgi:HPt (histidine-containing phosphotransfer) domain-containing protein
MSGYNRRTAMPHDLESPHQPPFSPWEPPPSLAAFVAIAQPTLIRELVDVFVQDAERQLGLLQAAAAAGDICAVARISHSIKGSAQSMGAANMIELSCALEEGARSGEPRNYPAEAGRLAVMFVETRSAMLAYCARTSA